jgi:PAS domain S-box-containing protein
VDQFWGGRSLAASLKGEVGYYEGDYLSLTAGKLTSVRAIFQPIFSSDGAVSGGLAIFEDISERKLAEEAFQSLVKSAPMGIYILQDGKFAMINPGFEVITGYHAQELIGWHCLGPVSPEYRAFVREQALIRLKEDGLPPYEYQFITKNGETGWVMETVTCMCMEIQKGTT